MPTKLKSFLKVFLQAFFVIAIFAFLGRQLLHNWNRLEVDWQHINYLTLSISLLLFTIAWLSTAIAWGYITKKFNKPLTKRKVVKLWVWSQAARYIPGSVWQVVGRVYMGEKEGLGKGKTLASVAVETSNLIISSLLILALSLPLWPELTGLKQYFPFLISGFLIFGFLHPRVFNATTAFFIKKLDNKEKPNAYSLKEIIWMLMPYLVIWLIFGLAFYFLTLSFKQVGISFLPLATGVFALSWLVGFLFVIAPGGLGAREIALVYMLHFFVGGPLALLLAILSRVLMIIAELLILIISAFF